MALKKKLFTERLMEPNGYVLQVHCPSTAYKLSVKEELKTKKNEKILF